MRDLGKLENMILPLMVGLVGLSCFGLGRLSVRAGEAPRLVINAPTSQIAAVGIAAASNPASREVTPDGRNLVASKNGTKYYLPSCSSANRIKEENKVWFSSATEAEAAGYGPAANCPGL